LNVRWLLFTGLSGCGWWITAAEHASRIDADLDGVSAADDCDDGDPTATVIGTVFADADGDGVGGGDESEQCGVPNGFSADGGDCDDAVAAVVDLAPAWTDEDGDGYGSGESVALCGVPTGFAAESGDCDDRDDAIHPGGTERCNGEDDACNGAADDGDPAPVPWYLDSDRDGWGLDGSEVVTCAPPDGTVGRGGDCDDGDAGVNPAAQETCSGVDDDCDGAVDAADPDMEGTATWYADADADGWGDASDPGVTDCVSPSSDAVQIGGDCADADPARSPGATEVCNALDDDCDDAVDAEDPDLDAPIFYQDDDGDGFGDLARPIEACEAPEGFVAEATDCDDGDDGAHPAISEVTLATADACDDAADNDCDAAIDGADDDCHDDDVDGAFNGLDPLSAVDLDGDGTREAVCLVAAAAMPPAWQALDAFRAIKPDDPLGLATTGTLDPAHLDVLGALVPGAWCWDLTGEPEGVYDYRYASVGSAADAGLPVDRFDCNTWRESALDAYCGAFDDPFCLHGVGITDCDGLFPADALRVDWDGSL
jgi:hypothetical protein